MDVTIDFKAFAISGDPLTNKNPGIKCCLISPLGMGSLAKASCSSFTMVSVVDT
jgi:hypothetical protein